MPATLGIDASTQSVSALVFDTESGTVLHEASVNFGKDLPQYHAPQGFIPGGKGGEVHADPRMWLDGLELCLERLEAEGLDFRRIGAISGAGQQHGTVYLNAKGVEQLGRLTVDRSLAEQMGVGFSRSTSPIWMDTSTTTQCREIEATLGGAMDVCRRSGSIAIERFSGPQIRRFAQMDPGGYADTARIHLVSSFMASVLAGAEAPIDHGDGAGMNLMNLETLDWDPELLEATDPSLGAKLPAARPSETEVGPVAAYFVERFGFAPSTKVFAFTGDNPSSLVGTGVSDPDTVIISLGTSDTLFAAMTKPHTDPKGYGHVFGNPLGGFMTLQCFLNGSLAREQVRDELGMDWDAFSAAIEATPAGNDGKWMLPFFGAEISPRVETEGPMTAGAFAAAWRKDPSSARACVEGQFLNMKLCSEWMQVHPSIIFLTGGASQNDAIATICANVFQAEVRRLSLPGSVALGGALRAGLANGMDPAVSDRFFEKAVSGASMRPDPNVKAAYDDALDAIRSAHGSLGV